LRILASASGQGVRHVEAPFSQWIAAAAVMVPFNFVYARFRSAETARNDPIFFITTVPPPPIELAHYAIDSADGQS